VAVVAIGLDVDEQLAHVAETMRVGSWLEPVLSWPARFVDSEAAPQFSET
jgi:hypothetical protein